MEGEKDVWEAVWTLPRAGEATGALPLEGDYDVRLSYDGIAGAQTQSALFRLYSATSAAQSAVRIAPIVATHRSGT